MSSSKNTRKTLAIALVIVVVVAAVGVYLYTTSLTPPTPPERVLTIGAVYPLTGPVAYIGNFMKSGVDLAVNQTNAAGGVNGWKLQVVYQDGKADASLSATAAQSLISVNNVKILLTTVTAACLALAPIATQAKVLLFSNCIAAPPLPGGGQYVFRITGPFTSEAYLEAQYAYNTLGFRKAAVLYVDLGPYPAGAAAFVKEWEALGGTVVANLSAPGSATDFSTELAQIKSAGADTLFLVGYSYQEGIMVKQARALGMNQTVLGSEDNYPTGGFQEVAGPSYATGNGVYFAFDTPDLTSSNSNVQNFVNLYKSTYNTPPPIYASQLYDNIEIIVAAIKAGNCLSDSGLDVNCLSSSLLNNVKNLQEVGGPYNILQNGDVTAPYIMFRYPGNGDGSLQVVGTFQSPPNEGT